jgi:hypothetical protein
MAKSLGTGGFSMLTRDARNDGAQGGRPAVSHETFLL